MFLISIYRLVQRLQTFRSTRFVAKIIHIFAKKMSDMQYSII